MITKLQIWLLKRKLSSWDLALLSVKQRSLQPVSPWDFSFIHSFRICFYETWCAECTVKFSFLLPFPSFLSLGICKPPPTTALPPCLSFSLGWLWSFPSIQYYKPLSIVLWAFCLHCHASLLYFFLAQFTACYLNYQKYLYRLLPFWNSYSSLDF